MSDESGAFEGTMSVKIGFGPSRIYDTSNVQLVCNGTVIEPIADIRFEYPPKEHHMAGTEPTYRIEHRLIELEKRVEALEGGPKKKEIELPEPVEAEELEGDSKKKKK